MAFGKEASHRAFNPVFCFPSFKIPKHLVSAWFEEHTRDLIFHF